jgi:hypothetical protein
MNIPAKEFTYYYTPRELDKTLDRLENWQRVYKDRPQYRVTPSLEGKYRSPQVWHPEEPKMPCDHNDAVVVERAIVRMPTPYKQIIVYKYMYPFLPFSGFCRKAKINPRNYEAAERKALDMIHNILMRAELFKQDVAQKRKV